MSQNPIYQLLFSLAIFIPLSVAEYFWMKRKGRIYPSKDVAASVGVNLGHVVTGTVQRSLLIAAFTYIATFQIHRIEMNHPLHWLALFLGVEFTYYWFHRFTHEVRWFWAAHSVHHSPNEFNLPAALRLGWTTPLSGIPFIFVPMVLIGFSPQHVFGMLGLNLLYQFWLHTDAVPKLWRPIEWIFNTPSHHRVHHGANPEYLDANYGGVVIVFDRLFGTCIEEREDLPVKYGLTTPMLSRNPFRIALNEYLAMGKDLAAAPTWKARFLYVFGRPGYSHDGSRETTAMVRARLGLNAPLRSVPMISRTKLAAAASILLIAFLGASCHRFGKPDPERKAAFINGRISSKLDFNDEQEAKLKGVSDEVVALVKEFKALRDRDHDALVALVKEPELDQAKVLAAVKERREKIEARTPAIVAKLAALHKTLTPEQREEIVEMIEDHRGD